MEKWGEHRTKAQSRAPKLQHKEVPKLWCCQNDNSTRVTSRPSRELPKESLQRWSLEEQQEIAQNLPGPAGLWEGAAVPRLSGHLIHTARHTEPIYGSRVPVRTQAPEQTSRKFDTQPSRGVTGSHCSAHLHWLSF